MFVEKVADFCRVAAESPDGFDFAIADLCDQAECRVEVLFQKRHHRVQLQAERHGCPGCGACGGQQQCGSLEEGSAVHLILFTVRSAVRGLRCLQFVVNAQRCVSTLARLTRSLCWSGSREVPPP